MGRAWPKPGRRKSRIGCVRRAPKLLRICLAGPRAARVVSATYLPHVHGSPICGGRVNRRPVVHGVDSYVKIYVGNLSFKATDDDLRAAFEPYGEVVSARVIKDKETGRSRGFGFVEMPNQEQGNGAIEKVNNTEIVDRAVRVNEAQERPPRR